MADFYLTGNATDWNAAASWVGGTPPSSGTTNRIIIAESGDVPVTQNLNQSSVNVNQILRLAGVRKGIGGNGNSLEIDVNNGTDPQVIDMGRGGDLQALNIDGTIPKLIANNGGRVFVNGGQVGATLLYLGPGSNVEVGSSAAFGASAGGGIIRMGGGRLVAHTHATDRIGSLIARAGTIIASRDFETVELSGPTSFTTRDGAELTDGLSGATLKVLSPDTRLILENDEDVTWDYLEMMAGRAILSGLTGDWTISDGMINLIEALIPGSYPGGTLSNSASTFGSEAMQDAITP